MLLSSPPATGASLIVIELALTALACTVAFAWPNLGVRCFSRMERSFAALARKPRLSVAVSGLSVLLLRLALLPLLPIPLPISPDDFSMLLAADTFAHGRLTNPTPAMWTHLESIHVTMQPTYMSMYFPAQGLLMAASKVLLGHPWWGILASSALMCAALCWMLQAWLPPTWALLGALLAVLRLGVFSYWVNSYTGAGPIAALGGALVLGALPRLMKGAKFRYALLMAVGIVLLATSRPYEGFLLCLPVAAVLGHWLLVGKTRPAPIVLLRRAAFPVALLVAGAAWMGYYDFRAFGSPLTLPYTVDRATYAVAPYYVWQDKRPAPSYRQALMRRFYTVKEIESYDRGRGGWRHVSHTVRKAHDGLIFLAGVALLPPLFMLRRVILDRRVRFLVQCLLIYMAGMAIGIYLIPHYLAPLIAVFYALGLQAMRHLRLWHPEGRPVGRAVVRFLVAICLVMAVVRVAEKPLRLTPVEWPPYEWIWSWYGPAHYGTERAQIETGLEQAPGKQLVLVQYADTHEPLDEWVYNAADPDAAKVVWAWDMGASSNRELLRYYKDRKAWLVQPDTQPPSLTPYEIPQQAATASN